MRFGKLKNVFILTGSAVLVGVVSFVITVSVFSKADKYYSEIANNEKKNVEYLADVSSVRTNPDALEEEKVVVLNDKVDLVVKDENVEEKSIVKIEEVEEIQNDDYGFEDEVETTTVSIEPVQESVNFMWPIDGEVGLDFADDRLVYSKTLEEWITHLGIDVAGDVAMPVKVSADGVIVAKKVDPRFGNTIIVEHEADFKTIYSNLSTLDLVEINQKVIQGDIISGVGEGYGFETLEGSHIHFEIIKNGEYVNPIDYFAKQ